MLVHGRNLHSVIGDVPARRLHCCFFGRSFDQDRVGIVDVDEDAAHMRVARERFQRPARAGDRHVAHAPAGLVAEAVRDHLVVGEERAVEEEGVRGGDALVQVVGDAGAAGRIDEPSPAGLDRDADRALADGVGLDLALFEPERNLSGHGEEFEREARQRLERLAEARPRGAGRCRGRRRRKCGSRRSCRASRACPRIAKGWRSRKASSPAGVIDIGVGEQHGGDRRMAPFAFRLQRRRRQNLLAQVDRGVEQEPCSRRRR